MGKEKFKSILNFMNLNLRKLISDSVSMSSVVFLIYLHKIFKGVKPLIAENLTVCGIRDLGLGYKLFFSKVFLILYI